MPENVREIIRRILAEEHPSSIGELKELLGNRNSNISDDELFETIEDLQSQGGVKLGVPDAPGSFYEYLSDPYLAWWLYLILSVAFAETAIVLYGPPVSSVLFLRQVLGLGMLGFIPGYSSQRALFPAKELTTLERVLLSVFLSVMISISIGIILGYFFLFQAGTNIQLLNVFTIAATLVAAIRSFRISRQIQDHP